MQYHTGDFFCPSWMCYYGLHVCCWHYLLRKRIIFSTWLKVKTFNLKLIIIFHFKRASLPTQRHYTYRLLEKVIRLRCCHSLLPTTLALSWDSTGGTGWFFFHTNTFNCFMAVVLWNISEFQHIYQLKYLGVLSTETLILMLKRAPIEDTAGDF